MTQSDILVGGPRVEAPARFNFTGQRQRQLSDSSAAAQLQGGSRCVFVRQKHFWHRIVHNNAV